MKTNFLASTSISLREGAARALRSRFTSMAAGIGILVAAQPERAKGAVTLTTTPDASYQAAAAQFAGSYLWLDAEYTYKGTPGSNHASAVRINDYWALTAAHNIWSSSVPVMDSITVGNGSNFKTNLGTTVNCSTDIIMFPGYNGTAGTPDLALIRLNTPLSGPALTLGSAGVGALVYSVGFGQYGNANTGLLPQDGNVRAFEAYTNVVLTPAVSDYYYNMTTFGYFNDGLTLNGRAAPGDSGSGVFNQAGELVGITTAKVGAGTDHGETYYMDLTNPEVSSWLNANIPEPSTAALVGLGAASLLARRRREEAKQA